MPLDEVAWSDWPISGEAEAAVWNLGLNVGMLEEVRPLVMREATALGLCVLDDQAGKVSLPGGKVLCLPGRKPAVKEEKSKHDDVPRTKDVLLQVYERLSPFLTERGFKGRKRGRVFVREFPGGWHELSVRSLAERWPLCAEFDVFVRARLHAISDLVADIGNPDRSPEEIADTATLLSSQQEWIDDGEPLLTRTTKYYAVRNQLDIDKAVAHLRAQLCERMLLALDACKTVEDFDRALNPPLGVRSFFRGYLGGKENIIAAYLAGNPDLEELCRKYDPRVRGWRPDPRAERCIDYVRSHPLRKGLGDEAR